MHTPGFPPPASSPRQPEFKQQLDRLIRELDSRIFKELAIGTLSNQFAIKSRRLDDFINVLSAIGCCRRSRLGYLIWLGRSQIPRFLEEESKLRDIDNPALTLCDLFPVERCVGMENLSLRFMLLFRAVRATQLDLRLVAVFFSRDTLGYNTVLCELYEVAFVLCAAGICNWTAQIGQTVLSQTYANFRTDEAEMEIEPDPRQIESLFNRPKGNVTADYALRRRKEIHELFARSSRANSVLTGDPGFSQWIRQNRNVREGL
jgi:hypothetical protein